MSDMLILALAVIIPSGLIILAAYKLLTRKKRPKLTLVEQPFWDGEAKAEKVLKEVVAEAKKINKKKKARKGKRRVKKN